MKKLTLIFVCLVIQSAMLLAKDYRFYIISNNTGVEKPIYLCSLNSNSGEISITEHYDGTMGGDYLALSPDNKHLLATTKSNDLTKAGIIQYDVTNDGRLEMMDKKLKTASDLPCHVSFTPDMQYALSANYGDDEISLYSFENKRITSEIDHIVKPDQSKGHFIQTDPSGSYVFAVFLGLNKVFSYTIESSKFQENENQAFFSLPAGSGPRHMVFHPNKDFAYIVNETNSSVTACNYNSEKGILTELQNINLLPPTYFGTNHAAAIRISPDGQFLYASSRGHNSIAVFKIEEDGLLSLVEHETEGINFPRDFNITPDGKFMIICNQKGNSIMSLHIDETSGELTNTGMSETITNPVSVVFLPNSEDTSGSTNVKPVFQGDLFYPNPAKEKLYLNPDAGEMNRLIEIYSMNGHLIKTSHVHSGNVLDVSEMNSGLYVIKANQGANFFQQKILID